MTEELKQAAQQALEVLKSSTSFMSKKARGQHDKTVARLERALTQPAAQATPEPDTCRKRPRCGRADPCAWLEKQAATPEPVGEVFWRVALVRSSHTPDNLVPWLCSSEKDVAMTRAHSSFVRWLTPATRPAPGVPEVDHLAQFIRQIDGNHSMGASLLAERICEWLAATQAKGGAA